MYNKIDIYRFILKNGAIYKGKVLAYDNQKIVIANTERRPPTNRVLIYQSSIMVAEPMGWKVV